MIVVPSHREWEEEQLMGLPCITTTSGQVERMGAPAHPTGLLTPFLSLPPAGRNLNLELCKTEEIRGFSQGSGEGMSTPTPIPWPWRPGYKSTWTEIVSQINLALNRSTENVSAKFSPRRAKQN